MATRALYESKYLVKNDKYDSEKYGDVNCSIAIDTNDAFNVTRVDDVVVNRYEAQIETVMHQHTDYADGGNSYEVCLHGELFTLAEVVSKFVNLPNAEPLNVFKLADVTFKASMLIC